jgi:hypothetical protein
MTALVGRFEHMLARLAAEGATGALYGHTGAVYLHQGAVAHAESALAPDLGIRLTACGRLSRDEWSGIVAEAGAEHRVGKRLVERGRLTLGELELCHLDVLFDAAYFALLPGAETTRFRPGVAHWLGPIRPVGAEVLRRETERRRALLNRVWPWPCTDAEPVVPRSRKEPDAPARSRTAPPVPHGQRAVLGLADGSRTPVQIAWLLGRSGFGTVLDVRRLAAAGLVATPSAEPATAQPAAGPPPAADPSSTDISLLMRLRAALEAHL